MKYEYERYHTFQPIECPNCNGTGGRDTRPKSGGDPFEDDIYYWNECNLCSGYGNLENHIKYIRRRYEKISNSMGT